MKASLFMLSLAVCASLCLNHVATARMLKSTAREAVLSGRCFSVAEEESMTSAANMRTLRLEYVKYNTKKSMYRDADILAVYTLKNDRRSLAGCADACLLDWRSGNNQTNGTDADTSETWAPVNITEPYRECEAFNFNIDTGICYILSGQTYAQLTSSDNFWSGKLVCGDLTTLDDWAGQVVA